MEFFTKIAGVTFSNTGANTENRQRIIRDLCQQGLLNEGQKLTLEPEPSNRFDPNAIKVIGPDGRQLGYLSKDVASSIADAIRKGRHFFAYVESVTGGTIEYAYGINIKIREESCASCAQSRPPISPDQVAAVCENTASNKKAIQEQLNIAVMIMNLKWFPVGPQIWDATSTAPYPTRVDVDGRVWSGEDFNNLCIKWKNREDYVNAIGGYVRLLSAGLTENGKLPVFLVRGFFKTLVCANAFQTAYSLATTVLADIQKDPAASPIEVFAFTTYWEELEKLAIKVIDNEDYSGIKGFCENYGDKSEYSLAKDYSEIHADMFLIRENIKAVYGI